MKQKESPTRREPVKGVISLDADDKDNPKLSKRQKKVYDLLCTGKRSVTDITIRLKYSDPRGYIRDIRDKGIIINDYWVKKDDVRFKRYWVESDKRSRESLPALKNGIYGRR